MKRDIKNIDNILFDLDGTLVDSQEGIINSAMYALDYYGISYSGKEELKKFIGPPLKNAFMEFYGFDKDKALQAAMVYREYYADKGVYQVKLYDGIIEMLASLKKAGKKIFLATSKTEKYAHVILEYFGISKYFDYIGGTDMQGIRDSKAKVLKYVLETTDTYVSDSVLVGDSRYDVLGAKELGMRTIAVLYGYGSAEEHMKAGPDYTVHTPGELLSIMLYKFALIL